ncbi:small acid-soluble spore protein P [Paenibacillus shunpengii]|uniref:Small acid-soluble spore protein P n=2 Tax=Paenibacillus TaxID=44249 RepID=A0AAX3MYV9_9BACL|nr:MULTISPECIES: small acid-soluble spore protein P [Paenibacillus]OMC62885.1 spore protein [Paenibacillus sp. FSL H7-0326]WDH82788.1 small acid-soluble spore protein P [Paenibacillus urinalis]GAK43340.1 hypothetical protein TCA2_5836 [Paenibacillus sp. TCA20]SDX83992.1 small acid-soluble spore protein P (minor) [Paenibacillus sp. PDC88]
MGKPRAVPVPEAQTSQGGKEKRDHASGPAPLSGSKKVKNRNHVDHNNPEG